MAAQGGDPEPGAAPIENFDPEKCTRLKVLGQGGQSKVWLAEYGGRQVVLKVPLPDKKAATVEEMLAAARKQQQLRHRNVLAVLAVSEGVSPPVVLLECALGGDLRSWHGKRIEPAVQWRVAREVAQALDYLHTLHPPIAHRDVKGSNVLLTSGLTAKLSDFDLMAELPPPDFKLVGPIGTFGFMAPEVMSNQPYDCKCDVFGYASLLYEITHSVIPFTAEDDEENSWDSACFVETIFNMVQEGNQPWLEVSRLPSEATAQLIHDCWSTDPEVRPTMAQVLERLPRV